jgi:hypothetical protein
MKLSYTEVAKRAKISRATLYRKIKGGEISTLKTRDGKNRVDLSECLRVFEDFDGETNERIEKLSVKRSETRTKRTETHVKHDETGLAVEVLQDQVSMLKEQLADAKSEKKELMDLLKMQMRLIPDQRESRGGEPVIPPQPQRESKESEPIITPPPPKKESRGGGYQPDPHHPPLKGVDFDGDASDWDGKGKKKKKGKKFKKGKKKK